ncbi:MAG: hypothetical protein EB059_11030, partial [Alphaproteobacteria bacterium]|nr:hypothetical protein [Alphaproteobacteria bacterium]
KKLPAWETVKAAEKIAKSKKKGNSHPTRAEVIEETVALMRRGARWVCDKQDKEHPKFAQRMARALFNAAAVELVAIGFSNNGLVRDLESPAIIQVQPSKPLKKPAKKSLKRLTQ